MKRSEVKKVLSDADALLDVCYALFALDEAMQKIDVPPEVTRSVRHLIHYMTARMDLHSKLIQTTKESMRTESCDA